MRKIDGLNKVYFISRLNDVGIFKMINKNQYHILKIISGGCFRDYGICPIYEIACDEMLENYYFFSDSTYKKIINDELSIGQIGIIDFEYILGEYGNKIKRYEKFGYK
jgi:hypothetical protein